MIPRFDYVRVKDLDQAIHILSTEVDNVRVLAGGTDVFIEMTVGHSRPRLLVDVKNIPGFSQLEIDSNGALVLGAAVTIAELEKWAAGKPVWAGLSASAQTIGSEQIRNRGTIVGNVCRASPAGDMIPMLIAMDARVDIVGPNGSRTMRVEEFIVGPGKTVLEIGELVKSITVPEPESQTRAAFIKLCNLRAVDISIVSAAAKISTNGSGRITSVGLVMGAVAPTPIRIYTAEEMLINNGVTDQTLTQISESAKSAAKPITDFRSTKDYRLKIVGVLARRSVEQAWQQVSQLEGVK